MKKLKTRDLILCALFAALVAVGAFLRVPAVLPFTMQNFFTMLAGLLLGGKLGAVSVLVYIALGLMGVPVFTGGGGLMYVLRPSFGYMLGFAVGAYVAGILANKTPKPSFKRLLAANFAGIGCIYAIGLPYYWAICRFYLAEPIGLWPLLLTCFLMTLPGDVVKALLAALLGKKLIPLLRRGNAE